VYEGCMSKLAGSRSKAAWFDPELARDSAHRYSRHVGKIRMDVETGNTAQPLFGYSTIPYTADI
jgi:hypothetical protein